MRQIKIKNNSCKVHKDFQDEITGCFDVYNKKKEEDLSFGLINGTAYVLLLFLPPKMRCTVNTVTLIFHLCSWTYHTEKQVKGSSHWGLLTTYSGAGYIQDLNRTKDDSATILQELIDNLWLDQGTRVTFIDFSTYNANINMFCVIR